MSARRATPDDASPFAGEVGTEGAGREVIATAASAKSIPPSLTLPRKVGGNRSSFPRIAAIVSLVVCITAFAGAAHWIAALGPAPLGKDIEFSTRVVDRDGRLLRAYATGEGRWRLPARVADVDPRLFDVLFAYEDKRFRVHYGVDPLALFRAALQLAGSGRILSGGSTLTMQVARLLESVSKPGDDPPPSVLRKRRACVNRVFECRRPAIKAVFEPSAVRFRNGLLARLCGFLHGV